MFFYCGLLESKNVSWLAASLDAMALIKTSSAIADHMLQLTVVEIKMHISTERIIEAEQIAVKYRHKLIWCSYQDEIFNECVDKEHSVQMMTVMVTGAGTCTYIAAKPVSATSQGKIIYVVVADVTQEQVRETISHLECILSWTLIPFFESRSIQELELDMQGNISGDVRSILLWYWHYFTIIKKYYYKK
jgi:hypothetical protein